MPRTINLLITLSLLLMGLIWLLGPYNSGIELTPDKGPFWYYWQLPDPTWLTRFSAWGGFASHQLFFWWLIASSKKKKAAGELSYQKGLQKHNYIALFGNLFFVLLHIVQTKVFYDGLAQDTHIFSGQFAVIILLALVLILENKRRGLLFGKQVGFLNNIRYLVKDYHGYYFSWAIVFTFWFHPIEITYGHLLGTFYAILIIVQGSLIFTRYHQNKYWTLLLETFVLLHGAVVAYMSIYHDTWPMFAFGFATLFFITQIYGLGLSKRVTYYCSAVYIVVLVIFYQNDYWQMVEVLRIPFILIIVAVVLAALLYLIHTFIIKRR
ncbi:hypothetical protein RGQ13_19040 [Thalassotalea psychrophila]|uniref:Serine active site containing 1-like protein n=1 Tax=Thalassotalea psychrophila TaxID=3065647 RepID=A0ABY9TTM8_9GAMM|nr:hypothetical protein RGQ13_19040 [Colwelliaceae bacterium SQ149]